MLDWIIGGALVGAFVGVIYAMMSQSGEKKADPQKVAAPSIDQLKELAAEVEDAPTPAQASPAQASPAQASPAQASPATSSAAVAPDAAAAAAPQTAPVDSTESAG